MTPSLIIPCNTSLSSSPERVQSESVLLSAYLGYSCSPTAEDRAKEVQESELEFLTTLDALHAIELDAKEVGDTREDFEWKENLKQCWRFRHSLAKEIYQRALWQQECELVLQKRWVGTQPSLKAECSAQFEGDQWEMAQSESRPSQSLAHGPKQSLRMSPSTVHTSDPYVTDSIRYQHTSLSQMHDPTASTTAVEAFITSSHQHVEEIPEVCGSQHMEETFEETKLLPLVDEEQKVSTQSTHVNNWLESPAVLCSQMDHNVSMVDRNLAALYKSMTRIAQLSTAAAEDLLVVAKARREHIAFRASWRHRRTLLDLEFSKAQAANEAILSSAAELLVEAAGLHIETDQIHASTEAELNAAAKLRAERHITPLHRKGSQSVNSQHPDGRSLNLSSASNCHGDLE